MAKPRSLYRRLTGKSRHLSGHSQLWLGPDHLLLVKSSRFVERYQRFALADIAAIVVTNGPDATIPRFMGTAAALLWTALALSVDSTFAKWFFLSTGALGLGLVLLDVIRGPRCHCHLYTAVSCELLTPVSRQSAARRFLAVIHPAIESVQGVLSPERIAEMEASQRSTVPVEPPRVPHARSYVQEVLFSLLLASSLLLLIASHWTLAEAPGLFAVLYFGEAGLLVLALIRGSRDFRRFSYLVVAAAAICFIVDLVNVGRDATGWFMQVAQSAQAGGQPPSAYWTPTKNETWFAEGWRSVAGVAGWLTMYLETRGNGPE